MCSASPPPEQNMQLAASQTAQGNETNLENQTNANRPDQVTPFGNSTWSQAAGTNDTASFNTAYQAWQAGGNVGNAPVQADYQTPGQYTQNISLTPAAQSALNDQQTIQANQSSLAQGLQGQVANTMQGGFDAPQLSTYLNGVGQTNQNISGFNSAGTGQTQMHLNTNGTQVNTSAPQFDQSTANAGATAAYNAQMGLLQPGMTQDTTNLDSQLRMQGLTPGTEAYNNAAQNLQRTQAQTTSTVANNAVQTGNNEANANYASALAGYGAQNTAIGQQYAQNSNTMTQNNAAQNQSYAQALAGYGANQSAQVASNAAQNQAFTQALGNYSSEYASQLANYNQPLNAMNAVLSGNQVSEPTMPTFATAGYTGGADMTGAANATNAYNQGVTNSANASSNATTGALASLGGAAAIGLSF
jgi:hypothetical protein